MFVWLSHGMPGVQSHAAPTEEGSGPRRQRTTSEGQSRDESPTRVRSPIRCISPELANTIALNPGGRPKEVDSVVDSDVVLIGCLNFCLHHLCLIWCTVQGIVGLHTVYACSPVVCSSRDKCTVTGRLLKRLMGAQRALQHLWAVRSYPKPLHSLSRHKPLTSTCVSFPTEGGGCRRDPEISFPSYCT